MVKKVKALLLACSVLAASVLVPGISAEERMVMTRDEEGNLFVMTEEIQSGSDLIHFNQAPNETTRCIAGEHGEVFLERHFLDVGAPLMITNGCDFRDEFMKRDWMSDIRIWLSWKEVTPDTIDALASFDYKEGSENWADQYGSDSRMFCVEYKMYTNEILERLARETDLKFEEVTDAVYICCDYESMVYWNGSLRLTINKEYLSGTESIGESEITFSEELRDYLEKQRKLYKNWEAAYAAWTETIDADSMTPAQLEASRRAAGVASDYEMLQKGNEVCQYITEHYSDQISYAKPDLSSRENQQYIHPVSVWQEIGDLDKDGELTTADVSLLLEAIANNGSGIKDGGLGNLTARADINADYEFDVADAVIILRYIAESGSGSNLTLKEIVNTMQSSHPPV